VLGPVASNFTRRRYAEAVQRILDYIRAGDCYQVNLAQRFSVAVGGDPWLLYRRLRAVNPAPFSAYLATPWGEVLSCSPEQFLEVRGRCVQTKPIKGTRPRSPEPGEDAALRAALRASPKDRAENVMIVDLLRNDLGKSCAIGSVQVPKLCEVESFATVHHLVSTVTGTLAPGKDALDLLRGCFPGGSITGAPKRRAMEIIEELEPHRRGIYCGSIGYLGYDGSMDTNIAIRTLVISGGRARFWAGGGIVADSDWRSEYQETLDKAAAFFTALEREPPA
jgi:para-aminobenzoate synthetase component 1